MNDKQRISYYRGKIANREAHIKHMNEIIRDMEFDIKQYNSKIDYLEQSQKGDIKTPCGELCAHPTDSGCNPDECDYLKEALRVKDDVVGETPNEAGS